MYSACLCCEKQEAGWGGGISQCPSVSAYCCVLDLKSLRPNMFPQKNQLKCLFFPIIFKDPFINKLLVFIRHITMHLRAGPPQPTLLIVRDEPDCPLSGCISTLSSTAKPQHHFACLCQWTFKIAFRLVCSPGNKLLANPFARILATRITLNK